MPKATDTRNTGRCSVPTPPTRRAIIAGSGAALILARATAAHSAEHPDAELIALGAEFDRLQAAHDPLSAEFFALDWQESEALEAVAERMRPLSDRQDTIAVRVLDLSARTMAGLTAKATVARGLFLRDHMSEVENGWLDEEDAAAWSLITDVLAIRRAA